MAEKVRVAVIGAGLGGLSCAARLARAGYAVDLFEQGPRVGCKAGSAGIDGYRFDTGPSLLTLTGVFDQLFAETGERREEWVRFIALAPICHFFYPDGTVLYSYADRRRFGAEIEAKTNESAERLARYLDYSRAIYELTADPFLWHSLHEPASYLRVSVLRTLLGLPRIDAWRSMHAANRSSFRDPRLVQFFDRCATYNGSDPYRTPATLNIIPHVEYGLGGYAVEGGVYSLPAAIARPAEAKGVRLHLNTRTWDFDVVVSNVDALRTYRELLGWERAPLARRYARLEPSSSGIVFLWGMKRTFAELGVNNIFFSRDYRREFRQIFQERICPEEPTVYVNITSKATPEDAPEGGENWFVLVNAPCDDGQDWAEQAGAVRRSVLARIGLALGRPVSDAIVCERVISPVDIERDTSSTRGSLYGIASNSPMTAFLRHPNRAPRLKGLYLCGGSVHPGAGMPLAVLSGKIASELIRKDRPACSSGA